MLDTICSVQTAHSRVSPVRAITRSATKEPHLSPPPLLEESDEDGGPSTEDEEPTQAGTGPNAEDDPATTRMFSRNMQETTPAMQEISREALIQQQSLVPKWEAMRAWKLSQQTPKSAALRAFVARFEAEYDCDSDGAVWRVCWRDRQGRLDPLKQLVVPPSMQHQVIQVMHNGEEGAHAKAWRTYHKIRERYWWPSLHRDVQQYVRQCPVCQLHGASQSQAPIAGHFRATRPGQVWVSDLVHVVTSSGDYSYMLVSVDVFSRYVEIVPLKGTIVSTTEGGKLTTRSAPNSRETAQAFMSSVVQHWGTPAQIITDGGSEFKLHFDAMCEALRVNHHLSTPHHSSGHGTVERCNRTVIDTIAKLVNDNDTHWHTSVPWCQLAYNASPQRSLFQTGGGVLSPAEAHTGARLHVAMEWDTDPMAVFDLQSRTVQDALAARNWISEQRDKYELNMDQSAENRKRRLRSFAVGELVALQYPGIDKLPQKLKEKYAGPYEVTAVPTAGSASYVLRRRAGGAKNFTAHVDRLKRYYLPEHLDTEEQPSLVTDRAPRSRLYEVHRVIAHRVTPEGRDYQVLWEPCADNDWDTAEITWEAEASLKCPERLQEYFKEQQYIAQISSQVQPTQDRVRPVQADLLQGDPTTLVARVCASVGIDPAHVLLVWASTPCETFSRADASNISRGFHHRDHQDPERPPKSDDLTDLKVLKAVEHDRFLPRLQMMVAADRQRGLSYNFMFENPRASLRCRPYMQLCAWPRVVEVVHRTVDLCAFGHVYKKGTDLWTSLTNWMPQGSTGNGKCNRACGQGQFTDTGSYQHFHALSVEPHRAVQGKGATAMRNAMPKHLLGEVLRSALMEASPQQNVVIDLCAGYRSLQAVCQAEGLMYVPVDIRYKPTEAVVL